MPPAPIPAWIGALARHGYTLDASGEIADLAVAVRPLSRRSTQIETNRVRLIAEWCAVHGGSGPSAEALQQIDRRAWAVSRPNKPTDLDERAWEGIVREEIAAIDPNLLAERAPVAADATDLAALDLDLLAAQAIVDADERSTSPGGRFSRFDICAGVTRALSRTGVVAPRDQLDDAIAEITARAAKGVVPLVPEHAPAHVKAYMATETLRAKARLVGQLDAVATPGRSLLPAELLVGHCTERPVSVPTIQCSVTADVELPSRSGVDWRGTRRSMREDAFLVLTALVMSKSQNSAHAAAHWRLASAMSPSVSYERRKPL